MDFSTMILTMYIAAVDGPDNDERLLDIAIEQSLLAGELGYNPWYTEHHFRGAWHSNPMQFAAYVAPQIPRERYLGFAGILQPTAQEKGIDLIVDIDPAARDGFRGDATRLRQVLLNLVGNAIKFTDRGEVSVAVTFHPGPLGELAYLRFEVADTGIGMSEDARTKLFQRFNQADSSITRRFGGTGLGLSISKELINMMGGRIGVQAAPSGGTLFWFEVSLPRAVSSRAREDHANIARYVSP